jgi:hypothetical protein
MKKSFILLVDALINLVLGTILVIYTVEISQILGIPEITQYFYPRILGAVLIGIALALFLEYFSKPGSLPGLGLGGAIAINVCGGVALAMYLIIGNLSLPLKGLIILWVLIFFLIVISGAELIIYYKKR